MEYMVKDITYEQSRQTLAAQAEMEKAGLTFPVRPRGDFPRVPERMTDLDDSSLMGIFARLTRWADYLSVQLALTQIEERYIDGCVSTLEAQFSILNWEGVKEDRVTLLKSRRDADPEIIAARQHHQQAYAMRKLTETLYLNAERDAALLSRELTRRIGRQEVNERRTARWTP